jgi:hypothetical protein
MTAAVQHISGGSYTGSDARPSSGNSGTITTDSSDCIAIWLCCTARALNGAADYHKVSSITIDAGSPTAPTVVKFLDQDFTYNDTSGGGSFPNAYLHFDFFYAKCPSALSGRGWDSTMAAAGDTFVNDGTCLLLTIGGIDFTTPFDTNADSNPPLQNSKTTSAGTSAPNTTSFDTAAAGTLVLQAVFGHKDNAGAPTTPLAPTGWTKEGQITSNGGAVATDMVLAAMTKYFSAQQSAQTYTDTHTEQFWATFTFAIRDAAAVVANTKRSFTAVIQ